MRISDWSSDVCSSDLIVRRDGDALGGQLLYLRLQRPGIEHHAIADNRQRAPHDAGRQQAELVGVLADDKRMAGIMPALETDDDIGSLRKPVDNLSLSLVAPLGADHGHIGHSSAIRIF